MKIAKTELTIQLERQIYSATNKQGVFGCFEVTIGWFGDERVDYITYDTKGIWRCYEIKVSKPDFYSKAKKTFVGHYNYFVLPKELYEEVKHDIPSHIGVYVDGNYSVKRAKKQELTIDVQVLKDSLIRSLSRESEKLLKSENPSFVEYMNRRLSYERKEKERYREQYQNLMREVHEKFGTRWRYS
ncbi:hypothetical protein J22TS1_43970 [Siminovitchia terrae]|uniref:hypothetical protein n=1 Tax=Siminovitchia terrae TaxID=1914933 RepID=UPI001B069029|nr:hypothetical protein [Siminovitchia terrae]GIN93346.1 hypothetical protein J22TS1_43970 [Siminovitchia terrae]